MSDIQKLSGLRVGFAVCGSFCTFSRAFEQLEQLSALGCELTPIMSHNAYALDTRFGAAQEHAARLYEITGRTVLHDITATEPVGPKKMFDVLVVAPCTGNTLAKLALGITDTPVCMAVKSHLRNQRPVVIAVSTNDALSGSAKNIGTLRNYKNFYFVPVQQDDCVGKPFSMVADFSKIPQTIAEAIEGRQIQPMLVTR
ncbi:MAG: dipicolinate synthase subunit B [Oscillospiraceae bacterium]|nr:dipicolinate synthase subunit B [Oscillospiraceae bacterium]